MRSIHLIGLELLLDSRIKIERINLIELKFDLTIILLKDNRKEFLVKKEKFQIFIDKIDKYIKEYYNRLLQEYLKVIKTL